MPVSSLAMRSFFDPETKPPLVELLSVDAALASGPRLQVTFPGTHRVDILSPDLLMRSDYSFRERIIEALDGTTAAHSHLAAMVLHPALAPTVGELLGLSESELAQVAKGRVGLDAAGKLDPDAELRGFQAIAQALGRTKRQTVARSALEQAGFSPSDLLTKRIPILPPSERPAQTIGGCRVDHPLTLSYVYLVLAMCGLEAVAGSPEILQHHHAASVQTCFERLLDAAGSSFAPSRWQPIPVDEIVAEMAERGLAGVTRVNMFAPKGRPDFSSFDPQRPIDYDGSEHASPGPDPTVPLGGAFIDDRRLLLRYPYAFVTLDGGEAFAAARLDLVRVFSGEDGIARAFFQTADPDFTVVPWLRNLDACTWESELPASFHPLVPTIAHEAPAMAIVDIHKLEEVVLFESGLQGSIGSYVLDPTGRYIAFFGDLRHPSAVYELTTGNVILDLGWLPAGSAGQAFARAPSGSVRVAVGQTIYELGRAPRDLPGDAIFFSYDGLRLASAGRDTLTIYEWPEGGDPTAVESRNLRPHHANLEFRELHNKLPELTTNRLRMLMTHHGTASELRAASLDEVIEAGQVALFEDDTIDADLARRVWLALRP